MDIMDLHSACDCDRDHHSLTVLSLCVTASHVCMCCTITCLHVLHHRKSVCVTPHVCMCYTIANLYVQRVTSRMSVFVTPPHICICKIIAYCICYTTAYLYVLHHRIPVLHHRIPVLHHPIFVCVRPPLIYVCYTSSYVHVLHHRISAYVTLLHTCVHICVSHPLYLYVISLVVCVG